uniref:Uncharacterized protein n=1 Tax=Siphoviridae sp. ct16C7 TaxID=2825304 RepID=A0A8S5NZB4_9CAUD|nr:MAG TPA: hypothetical protein [Siphoviridae sp. ct16C7]
MRPNDDKFVIAPFSPRRTYNALQVIHGMRGKSS